MPWPCHIWMAERIEDTQPFLYYNWTTNPIRYHQKRHHHNSKQSTSTIIEKTPLGLLQSTLKSWRSLLSRHVQSYSFSFFLYVITVVLVSFLLYTIMNNFYLMFKEWVLDIYMRRRRTDFNNSDFVCVCWDIYFVLLSSFPWIIIFANG